MAWGQTGIEIGEEYGWLTVLGEGTLGIRNKKTVHVRCRCGKEYDVQPGFLIRSKEPKCRRCSNKEKSQRFQELNRHDFNFRIEGDTAIGTLPSGHKFIIDAEDVERVSERRWYKKADQNYILSDIKVDGKLVERIRLHRFVLGLADDDSSIVDHINRNPMDCRKSNLRLVTEIQNHMNISKRNNASGFAGVHFFAGKYDAYIVYNHKSIRLGRNEDPVLCAQMYNYAAKLLRGEFAGELNDVPEAPPDVKKIVEERCKPYMELAARLTAPLQDAPLTAAV